MGANQANCKSETLTMNMAKEVGAVAQRLAFGFEQFTSNCIKKKGWEQHLLTCTQL